MGRSLNDSQTCKQRRRSLQTARNGFINIPNRKGNGKERKGQNRATEEEKWQQKKLFFLVVV